MAPSFFKILINPFSPHLQLPPDFVSKHLENKIPSGPIIICVDGGHSWRLKIKQFGDGFCFANGWSNVVKDIPLGFADFLIFRLVDQSIFQMKIYSPNGCEKILPPNDDNDGDDNNDDEQEEEDDDDDPFFTLVITKSHMYMLRFPPEFVDSVGIQAEGTLNLKNLDGKEWVLGLRVDKGQNRQNKKRYCLSSGWRAFLRENDLSEGDECVFKFIISEGKLLLTKVTKK